jgi:hypothetical protein
LSRNNQSYAAGVIAIAAVVNPLAILIKGKNLTVEKGKIFSTYVAKDYEFESNSKVQKKEDDNQLKNVKSDD